MLCKFKNLMRILSLFIVASLFLSLSNGVIAGPNLAYANSMSLNVPSQIVSLSENYSLPTLKGIKFDAANPFDLQLIIDRETETKISEEEKSKILRYFLTGLAVPEDKLWVNLSPYENDRIIADVLLNTEIGETLLVQDYLLKQLSSSLTHPDSKLGKKFWERLDGSKDAFKKIWISPGSLSVYDDDTSIFITELILAVQTEDDYLAKQKNESVDRDGGAVREIIVPEIIKDVNHGRNFAPLRQMIDSLVLAQCFKKKFAKTLYEFYYDSEKISGLDIVDPKIKEEVFQKYVESFDKGAYAVSRKIKDSQSGRLVKKAYFSGGVSSSITEAKQTKPLLKNLLANTNPDQLILQTAKLIPMQQEIQEAASSLTDVLSGVNVRLTYGLSNGPTWDYLGNLELAIIRSEVGTEHTLLEVVESGVKNLFPYSDQPMDAYQDPVYSHSELGSAVMKVDVVQILNLIDQSNPENDSLVKSLLEAEVTLKDKDLAVLLDILKPEFTTNRQTKGLQKNNVKLIYGLSEGPTYDHIGNLDPAIVRSQVNADSTLLEVVESGVKSLFPYSDQPMDAYQDPVYPHSELVSAVMKVDIVQILKLIDQSNPENRSLLNSLQKAEVSLNGKDFRALVDILKVKVVESQQTQNNSVSSAGGIDLNGITAGLEVSESSSSISVSAEIVDSIKGFSFELVGEGKVLPLNRILMPALTN